MKQKRVESLVQVDVSDLKMPLVVVFDSPDDMTGLTVARVFDCDRPTNTYAAYRDLDLCRADIKKAGYQVCIKRAQTDVPALVESWIL